MKETLLIKNMVCRRCVSAVEEIACRLGIDGAEVSLGRLTLPAPLSEERGRELGDALLAAGFAIVRDEADRVTLTIKRELVAAVRGGVSLQRTLPELLEPALRADHATDYDTASRLFSQREGRTVERYLIALRLEYVKELLEYRQYSVKEIAWRAGFSDVAHLSRQFKKLTGLTPTAYRECRPADRIPLDQV